MAEPLFFDNGVCFTVRFPNSALIPDGDLAWIGGLEREAAAGLNRRQKEALVDMRHGRTWSNGEYRGSSELGVGDRVLVGGCG